MASALLLAFAQPAAGDSLFVSPTRCLTGNHPRCVALRDLNGDWRLDMLVANEGSNTVSVLLADSTGGFRPKADYATGSGPFSCAIGDLDGDWRPDLAVANYSAGTVSVLLGNGDGTFRSKTDYAAGSNPFALAFGDLNGDGALDVVSANWNLNNKVSVMLGNGDGTLQPRIDVGVGSYPIDVGIGDLNGDWSPDLCVVNQNANTVSVLLGNGNGTFQPKVDYPTGSYGYSCAIGDLNGDWHPDLAIACRSSSSVAVLLGHGDGTFGAKTEYAAGSYPLDVKIGDLDGDGVSDLATADFASNTASVLRGYGDGTFRPAMSLPAGRGPISLGIGDLNGDWRPDLALADWGTSGAPGESVTVLHNVTAPRTTPRQDMIGHTATELAVAALEQLADYRGLGPSSPPVSWEGTYSDTTFALDAHGSMGADTLIVHYSGTWSGTIGGLVEIAFSGSGELGSTPLTFTGKTSWPWNSGLRDYHDYTFEQLMGLSLPSLPQGDSPMTNQASGWLVATEKFGAAVTGAVISLGREFVSGSDSTFWRGVVNCRWLNTANTACTISSSLMTSPAIHPTPPPPPPFPGLDPISFASPLATAGLIFTSCGPTNVVTADDASGRYHFVGSCGSGSMSGMTVQTSLVKLYQRGNPTAYAPCVFPGICCTGDWGTGWVTDTETAAGYRNAQGYLDQQGRLHLVLLPAAVDTPPITVTIPTDFFVGTPVSNAFGYDSVYVMHGTYDVASSSFPGLREVVLPARLARPHATSDVPMGGRPGAMIALSPPRPNPTTSSVAIEFELAAERSVAVSVHDVSGRLVRRLLRPQTLSAGRHKIRWDGRDDQGRLVPAGIFAVRLTAGDSVVSRRVTLIR
jgi:hypothetical protein